MIHPDEIRGNRLLAAMTHAGGAHIQRHLERVELTLGQVLYEPGRPQCHAYFPTSAIASLHYVTRSGASSEIAVVGSEGMVGMSLLLGGGVTTSHGSVLIAGQGFSIGARWMRDEFARSVPVRCLLMRYTQALMAQIAQTVICNRHHTVDQQVCGWLLRILDRLGHGEVVVTHERLASVLGVRRESVTGAAGRLQAAGLIHCTRGHLSVLDRAGIERGACECHADVKREYDRLLPQQGVARPASPPRLVLPAWDDAAALSITRQPQVAAAWPNQNL